MLELEIQEDMYYSEKTDEVFKIEHTKLRLEHSLISLRKWESKWHKPFLSDNNKTMSEILDYVECMTIGAQPNPIVYKCLSSDIIEKIISYIEDPMTATWFTGNDRVGAAKKTNEVITAEIIYYWMITLNIPVEFEKWHLNQLLTLIKTVSMKNSPKKPMSKEEERRERAILNAKRRAEFHSKG